MRVSINPRFGSDGNTLLITIVATAIIGIALASYLRLVTNQNQLIMRSQVWNAAIAVTEAGLEEALTHANLNYPTNMGINDWVASGGDYSKSQPVGDGGLGGKGKRWGQLRHDYGYYDATIKSNTPNSITVTSAGYSAMPGGDGFVGRRVRITATNQPVFFAPLVLKDKVDLNGNNILTDSYDSTDPNKNTLGRYDPLKAGDKGDVACLGGVKNAYVVGNANIWGHAITGPSGAVEVGPNGAVGSVSWQRGGNSGVEPGWWLNDLNYSMTDVKAPFSTGLPPVSGMVGTNLYEYILASGNYVAAKLDGNTLVTGDAVLYVTSDIKFGSSETLTILPGASLKLYAACSGTVLGIVDNQNISPATFMYFGLPANKTIDLGGKTWLGCIYAPSAQLILNGVESLYGSLVAGSAKLNGNSAIHYDESLRALPPRRGFIVNSWSELGWNEI